MRENVPHVGPSGVWRNCAQGLCSTRIESISSVHGKCKITCTIRSQGEHAEGNETCRSRSILSFLSADSSRRVAFVPPIAIVAMSVSISLPVEYGWVRLRLF